LDALSGILSKEIERINELLKKSENAREERKEAIRHAFRKTRGKSGSPMKYFDGV
jgi:hypothetical protein